MTKTISFALMHFSVAFGVTYALTGDAFIGSAVALVEPAVNTVVYHIHERVWERRRRRRGRAAQAAHGGVPLWPEPAFAGLRAVGTTASHAAGPGPEGDTA
jgi:uncharacterized membrane protein